MVYLIQIIRLLSEPPGNIIYHLITLIALQVVFALSYSRWRRDDDDDLARRMMWASAAIFLGRLLMLFVGLYYNRDPQQAAGIFPPLEHSVNTATAILLTWSLIPRVTRWPRLWDILLVLSLVLIGVLYLFSAQEWVNLIESGTISYTSTSQNVVWAIIQIIALIGGLIYLLLNSQRNNLLPSVMISILLLATIAQMWNFTEIIASDTNVPYWTRLGYLITFPLWAIYAYQHYLTPLIESESIYQDSVNRFGETLAEAAEVIATRQRERRISKSLTMASHLLEAAFISIGLVDHRNSKRLNFFSNLDDSNSSTIKQWAIDLSNHATLNAAFIQGQTIELLPTGLGARQLHEFYSAFGAEPQGPLLIHPLMDNGTHIGLLVVSAHKAQDVWTDEQKLLIPGLATYISQAIINSDLPSVQLAAAPQLPEPRDVTETVPSAIFLDQVRLNSLEAERDELQSALDEAVARRKQAEEKALVIQKQARYLAAALRAAQEAQQGEPIESSPMETIITGAQEASSSHSEESTDS